MNAVEFTETYIPLSESLYRVAFHILESEDEARDAVQDLYVRLWSSAEVLDSVHNPKAYCITLLKNICIDRIRKLGKVDTAPPPDRLEAADNLQKELEDKERLKKISEAIRQLPQAQRTVLQLRVFEDLSYEEIHRRTGINDLTSRVLLSQARAKLKKLL